MKRHGKFASRIVSALVALLVVFSLSSVLSGCSNNDKIPDNISLAIVIGRHANQYDLSDDIYSRAMPYIRAAVYDTATDMRGEKVYGTQVKVVIADGDPRLVPVLDLKTGDPFLFKMDAKNNPITLQRIGTYSDAVVQYLKSDYTLAKSDEVDLLEAVRQAYDSLKNETSGYPKHILILDPCVSTLGRVDLTNFSVDDGDTQTFISELASHDGILPDLSDVSIHILGLGDVSEPQILPDTTRPNLIAFWKSLFSACGVAEADIEIVTFAKGNNSIKYTEGGTVPYVSNVQFSAVQIVLPTPPVTIIEQGDDPPVKVDDPVVEIDLYEFVQFEADKAIIKNKERAMRQLAGIAQQILEYIDDHPSEKLYIVGTTSIGAGERYTPAQNCRGGQELSQQRADVLKALLVELDVPPDKIITFGVGSQFPGFNHPYQDNAGNQVPYDEYTAQSNRTAALYNVNNEMLHAILQYNGITIADLG
jgi:outer membrane protein OmpA-like peptidoglycan-associated protein